MVKWTGVSITLIELKKVMDGLPDEVAEELAQDCDNMLEQPPQLSLRSSDDLWGGVLE